MDRPLPPSAFALPGETRLQRALRWRRRAEELRTIADGMHDTSAQEGLRQVAGRLEVLAAWLEVDPA